VDGRRDYVQISREEIEGWLQSLPWKWSRKQGRQGVYFVHFSDLVGVAVSTTVGRDDRAVGRARGSMQLSLVSLVTEHALNRKAKDRKHFQRTKNWKQTWADGIKHWLGVYQQSKSFYDAIAPIENRAKYQSDMLARIEAVPGWDADRMLQSFHEQVGRGGVLTSKQVAIIDRAEKTPAKPVAPTRPAPGVDEDLLNRLRGLYAQARRRGDQWTMDFAQSIAEQLKRGRVLSPKQQTLMDKKFQQFRLATAARRLAAAYVGSFR